MQPLPKSVLLSDRSRCARPVQAGCSVHTSGRCFAKHAPCFNQLFSIFVLWRPLTRGLTVFLHIVLRFRLCLGLCVLLFEIPRDLHSRKDMRPGMLDEHCCITSLLHALRDYASISTVPYLGTDHFFLARQVCIKFFLEGLAKLPLYVGECTAFSQSISTGTAVRQETADLWSSAGQQPSVSDGAWQRSAHLKFWSSHE